MGSRSAPDCLVLVAPHSMCLADLECARLRVYACAPILMLAGIGQMNLTWTTWRENRYATQLVTSNSSGVFECRIQFFVSIVAGRSL